MTDYVTWPRLLEWARAHGAINDRIIEMKISVTGPNKDDLHGVVTITGHALDENGRPYSIHLEQGPALWMVNEPLRALP